MRQEKEENSKKLSRVIKKHTPKILKKTRKLLSFKYPKLFLLAFSIIVAYYIFSQHDISRLISSIGGLNYLAFFLFGILFSFGFTAPFSIGFFLSSQYQNPFVVAILGGVGAMIGDLFIFKIIKFSFMSEFEELEKGKIMTKIKNIIENHTPTLIRHYLMYVFAGIIIATPLPDEIGVSMLAGLTAISEKKLALVSFVLNTLGILLVVFLGTA